MQDVLKALDVCPYTSRITTVISGGCPSGADAAGEQWASSRQIPVKVYPADWQAHGRAAGPMRNRQMAANADALIAVWDGASRGTANMIQEAKLAGLSVFIYNAVTGLTSRWP